MNLEVLLATMNQNDHSIIGEMKVVSDIIVCNQNREKTAYFSYMREGKSVKWYDFEERGVGLNRNNALLRSTADICLLADDDTVFVEGYEELILNAFKKYPSADIIIFNIHTSENERRYVVKKKMNINRLNCGKFGAVRIAFKRSKIIKNSISFNQLFGGGAMFTAGEDTIFLEECLKKGLKAIAVPDYILTLKDSRPSSWFEGYNDKFFEDMGSSYYCHYKCMAIPLAAVQLVRKRNSWMQERKFWQTLSKVKLGVQRYKQL